MRTPIAVSHLRYSPRIAQIAMESGPVPALDQSATTPAVTKVRLLYRLANFPHLAPLGG